MTSENRSVRAKKDMDRKISGAEILGANSEIGRKLQQYYDEIASDKVPDRFAQLLNQLEQAEADSGKE